MDSFISSASCLPGTIQCPIRRSHPPTKNGGEAVGYQGRKATKTINSLFLADNTGLMLAMATPQEGQHPDLFEIGAPFEQLTQLLQAAGIDLKGVFLNADAGFGSQLLRQACQRKQIQANIKPNNLIDLKLE